MTSSLLARRRVVLPILAGLALASLPAAAQQQQLYGGTGYGTSIVGAYNPYNQAGPGQTTGRAYGAAPVAPYPPAYGGVTAQGPARRPGAAPAAGPRVPYAQPPAGQVGAYNPWRPQPVGGYAPEAGSRPPAFYAPYGPYTETDPGTNLPPPPAGPIRSRLLSIPEVGNPPGPSAPFQSVPYAPRRSGAVKPATAPRTVATAPAPTQVAYGGTADTAPPAAPAGPPRIANPPRGKVTAEPKPAPAPAVTTAPPEAPKPVPVLVVTAAKPPEPPKPAPAAPAPVVAAKPPEAPKPAPAPPVAAKPPEPPKPAPAPPAPVVAAKPPEPAKPAPAVIIERPTQTAALVTPPTTTLPRPTANGSTRVTFESNSPALSADARGALDRLAADLVANPARKTTLKAYSAGGTGPETRRLSLARGLAVRAYLIDKGVPRERLDVQALGTTADGGPVDRVDAVTGTGT